jgi:hypothetical protein
MDMGRPRKTEKRIRRQPAKITQELYDQAWAFYEKDQNADHLRLKFHLNPRTVYKLVNDGYPVAGFVALRDRLLSIRAAAARKVDYRMADLIADNIQRQVNSLMVTQVVRDIASKRLSEFVNALNAGNVPAELKDMTLQGAARMKYLADENAGRIIESAAFLLNGGSSKVTVNQSDPILEILVTECAGKTRAEKEYYLKHRRWPEDG